LTESVGVVWLVLHGLELALAVAMTQGKLEAVTLEHWLTALSTGSLTGLIALIASVPLVNRYLGTRSVALLGTFFSDLYVHTSRYGAPYSEAMVTAFGALGISLLLSLTPVEALQAKLKDALAE